MTEEQAANLVERFAAIPYTGAISDILNEMGLYNQVLPHEIQSISVEQTLARRALTLLGEMTESDDPELIFAPFLKMLGEIQPGAVLVSQADDSNAAHLGELSSETAQLIRVGRIGRTRQVGAFI